MAQRAEPAMSLRRAASTQVEASPAQGGGRNSHSYTQDVLPHRPGENNLGFSRPGSVRIEDYPIMSRTSSRVSHRGGTGRSTPSVALTSPATAGLQFQTAPPQPFLPSGTPIIISNETVPSVSTPTSNHFAAAPGLLSPSGFAGFGDSHTAKRSSDAQHADAGTPAGSGAGRQVVAGHSTLTSMASPSSAPLMSSSAGVAPSPLALSQSRPYYLQPQNLEAEHVKAQTGGYSAATLLGMNKGDADNRKASSDTTPNTTGTADMVNSLKALKQIDGLIHTVDDLSRAPLLLAPLDRTRMAYSLSRSRTTRPSTSGPTPTATSSSLSSLPPGKLASNTWLAEKLAAAEQKVKELEEQLEQAQQGKRREEALMAKLKITEDALEDSRKRLSTLVLQHQLRGVAPLEWGSHAAALAAGPSKDDAKIMVSSAAYSPAEDMIIPRLNNAIDPKVKAFKSLAGVVSSDEDGSGSSQVSKSVAAAPSLRHIGVLGAQSPAVSVEGKMASGRVLASPDSLKEFLEAAALAEKAAKLRNAREQRKRKEQLKAQLDAQQQQQQQPGQSGVGDAAQSEAGIQSGLMASQMTTTSTHDQTEDDEEIIDEDNPIAEMEQAAKVAQFFAQLKKQTQTGHQRALEPDAAEAGAEASSWRRTHAVVGPPGVEQHLTSRARHLLSSAEAAADEQSLHAKLIATETEADSLRKQYIGLVDALSSLSIELEQMRKRALAAESAKEAAEEKSKKDRDELLALQAQQFTLTDARDSYAYQLKCAKEEIEDLRTKLETKSRLADKAAQLEVRVTALEKDLSEALAAKASFMQSTEEERKARCKAELELERVREVHTSCETTIAALRLKAATARELRAELNARTAEVDQLRINLNATLADRAQVDKHVESLKKTLDRDMEIIGALEQKIARFETEQARREALIARARRVVQSLVLVFGAEFASSKSKDGVLVRKIVPGEPAEQAGLKKGDLITSANGLHITSKAELMAALSAQPPDTLIRLGVVRRGTPLNLDFFVGVRGWTSADLKLLYRVSSYRQEDFAQLDARLNSVSNALRALTSTQGGDGGTGEEGDLLLHPVTLSALSTSTDGVTGTTTTPAGTPAVVSE